MQHQDKVIEVEPVCLFAVSVGHSLVYGINICENCLVEYITDDGDRYPPPNNHSFVSVIRFNKERVRELRALRELTQPHQLLSPGWLSAAAAATNSEIFDAPSRAE